MAHEQNDGLVEPTDSGAPVYDVALSYAAQDAEYVVQFRDKLEAKGVRLFDSRREQFALWGARRTQEVERIFGEVQHVILFVSQHYVQERTVEWDSAVANALTRPNYALPVALDTTALPGLADIGYYKPYEDDGTLRDPADFAESTFTWLTDRSHSRHWSSRESATFGWDTFDPGKLHCIVVGSEDELARDEPDQLVQVVRAVFAGPNGDAVWVAARAALNGQQSLGTMRAMKADYDHTSVRVTSLSILEAFRSEDSLDRAVRCIVQADIAVFDVTGFEPGVMLLLGVRAATRRGMTVTSHGGRWHEGAPLSRPFNLSDLSLASHARSDHGAGDNWREERLATRLTTGFQQMQRQPRYQDLPVYDALRQLGSEPGAWEPIPLAQEILVLCTYDERYFTAWQSIRNSIREGLSMHQSRRTVVARLQDFATPQVVSQALYEKIRRCVGCIVDWTYASPSTFFELGVRLAASPWGTVQIVDRTWRKSLVPEAAPSRQLALMQQIFEPLNYGIPGFHLGDRAVEQLVNISKSGGTSGHRLRRVAADVLSEVQPKISNVADALSKEADSLDNPRRERLNVPQTLFFEAQAIKIGEEKAALERRLAAWLYLEHRVRARDLPADDPRRGQWTQLGRQVAERLLSNDDDIDLGIMISDLMESE